MAHVMWVLLAFYGVSGASGLSQGGQAPLGLGYGPTSSASIVLFAKVLLPGGHIWMMMMPAVKLDPASEETVTGSPPRGGGHRLQCKSTALIVIDQLLAEGWTILQSRAMRPT